MGSIATEDVPETGSAREVISQLEQQYMRLLRSRIADLESQLATAKQEKASDDDKSAAAVTTTTTTTTTTKEGSTSDSTEKGKEADNAGTTDKSTDRKTGGDEPRYVILISRWDSSRAEYVDTPADIKPDDASIGPKPKSKKSFTLKKLHTDQISEGSDVAIEFEPLAKLIGDLTSKWGWPEEVTSCSSPYSGLIYSWDQALRESQRIVEDKDDQQARADLKELLRLLSTSSGDEKLDRYFKDRPTFEKEKSITYECLWTLFPPGTLVVAKPLLDQPQIFCAQGYYAGRNSFYLDTFCLDWNGFEFNRVPFELRISSWGEHRKSINELPFYPIQYYKLPDMTHEESRQQLEDKLIQRGRKYYQFCITEKGRQMFNYDGNVYFDRSAGTLRHRSNETNNNNHDDSENDDAASMSASHVGGTPLGAPDTRKKVKGAVMVDFGSFYEYQPPRSPVMGPLRIYGELEYISPERRKKEVFREMYHFDWDKHPRHMPLTNTQCLLCPPRLLGYALKQRIWGQFLIENLSDPDEKDSRTFNEKLQLDRETKSLIQNSVMAHEQGKKVEHGRVKGLEDFAPGKGRGLIIMLYGMPGVGKTLTAESVALMAGKPLLSVGVSDIGIEGEKVEKNLQRVFDLAGLWEAVLLFDEADVFLEARGEGENDLRRNAMVSVLLRVLEYYDGILILTTNRMRSFDVAVQSRIHLAIKYQELSPEQRESIFLSFIDQLKSKNQVDEYTVIKQWVRKEGCRRYVFNGRQIRNIVSTALGIAISEGRKLIREDLASVAGLTDDFKRDLYSQEVVFNDRQMNARR